MTSGVPGAAGAGGAQRGAGGLEAAAGLVRTAIKAGLPPLSCFVCARIPRGGPGLGGCPGARHSPAEGGSGSGAGGAGAAAMARRQKAKEAKAAAAGKRRAPAALPSPASSSEDEAPEEVPFGVAREAAEAERKLVGEAARRHRELLKEKRRRHQELFAEQKKRRLLPEAVLQELQELQDVSARPAEQAAADDPGEELEAEAVELEQGQDEVQEKKGKKRKGARTNRNYVAVCLKDHSATGLHQQLAKDFLNAQLYGPHTNRVPANEFFSLANKRAPVKKAAVQFVDKSWGQDKKEKAARFKKRWLATHIKNGV
uniref:nucleolar protein 7 isoform X2 n=1 Tax=Agelaius phoeniceus TaxID=39638 RepID=UPI0023EC5AC0|nr:nucleolar protein 7 isoform X2 [Agelaius phoeniceus]